MAQAMQLHEIIYALRIRLHIYLANLVVIKSLQATFYVWSITEYYSIPNKPTKGM